jgi:hypothetical protein
MQPAPQTLHYDLTITGSDTHYYYFDFFRDLSVASRRFLRQGSVLPLQGLRFVADKTCTVKVAALPYTWVTAEAWEASFRAWQKLNRRAMADDEDSEAARYLDFKVFFDSQHADAGSDDETTVLQPVGHLAGTGSSDVGYEWIYSQVNIPEDLDIAQGGYQLHMIGDNDFVGGNSLGMIHNYALSRARPQDEDPNMPVDDLGQLGGSYLNLMFDFAGGSLQDVIEEVVGDNNEPPYPVGMSTNVAGQPTGEFYPGGANFLGAADQHEYARTSIYNNQASTSANLEANGFLPGAILPLGLLRMTVINHDSGGLALQVYADMVPGERRGYTTISMLEMNS